MLAPRIEALPIKTLGFGIVIGCLVMVIIQLLIVTMMPVSVYHDPYRVLAQADLMAAGHYTWNTTYFWRYVNNVPLAYFLSLWLRLTQLVGLSTNAAVNLLNMALLDGFIGLLLTTVWQFAKRKSLLVGVFVFCAGTPFAYTYYLQVFYSDLPTMLILLIIMRIFWHWPAKTRLKRVISGAGLVLAVLLGALIKANLIVLLPAVLIIGLMLAGKHMLKPLKLTLPILLVCTGFALSLPAAKEINQLSRYTPNDAYAFPITNWMLVGFNSQTHGKYAPQDVQHAIALPNKAARQQYDRKLIRARIKHLGFFGLIKLWVNKLIVLLNVQGIQNWYNGGFRAAPGWYQAHVATWQALTKISYTIATWTLWVMLGMRLLIWRPNWRQPQAVSALLAILLALGYLAFHTLLWEAEARYGQVLLPLVWLVVATLPAPAKRVAVVRRTKLLPLAALAGLWAFIALPAMRPKLVNHVVAAQRSQLSTQYHAKPTAITAHTVLQQNVTLNDRANYFSVQIHAHAHVQVSLLNRNNHHQYHLVQAGAVYKLHHDLTAGSYQIIVVNTSPTYQPVDVVATSHYQLSVSPLVINGQIKPTASLIYTCIEYSQGG